MTNSKVVSVVDDDESVRESLPQLLRSFGFKVEPFASAEAFLDSASLDYTDCLILDVAMPGMSGPELQQELAQCGHNIPTIFITAYSDDWVHPEMLRRGAVAFLSKPFSEAALLDAVNAACELGRG